ncbi:hypothetical protein LUW77_30690 [Streptomyces radiopugnans]|nr:hypothetical protein LUW77_30690 [Streptomyces radiopugnans]
MNKPSVDAQSPLSSDADLAAHPDREQDGREQDAAGRISLSGRNRACARTRALV